MAKRLSAYERNRNDVGRKELQHKEQESECVSDLEYDPETHQMVIHFVKRGSYLYYDVEPWLFAEFNNAGSRGTYFNLYVRPMFTNYERIA